MADETQLRIAYGKPSTINEDVDLFESFYRERFRARSLAVFVRKMRQKSLVYGITLCALGMMCSAPMFINASSIFAVIILLMGIGLCGLGVYFLVRSWRAPVICERSFDKLLDADLYASRSETKRIFTIDVTDEGMTVNFGMKTAVRQKRALTYDDMRSVYLTDDLIFIQGLTWFSRFQLQEEEWAALQDALIEHVNPIFLFDQRKALPAA